MDKKTEVEFINAYLSQTNIDGSNAAIFFQRIGPKLKLTLDEVLERARWYKKLNWVDHQFRVSGNGLKDHKELLEKEILIEIQTQDQLRKNEAEEEEHRRNERRLTKWQLKTYWWVLAFSVVSTLYCAFDIYHTYFGDSDYIRKDELESYVHKLSVAKNHLNISPPTTDKN